MGKVCETCGMTRWENRQVTGWVDATRAENERLRTTLQLATDGLSWACGALEVHGYEKDNYARRTLERVIVRDMRGT